MALLSLLLLQFLLCAVAIAWGGYTLSRSADRLADLHGWGRGWVGLALLATVTSLPELSSGLSSVLLHDAPDLAVGNVLGACVVNLTFLVVVDLLHREAPMYRLASDTHLLSAGFGVVMLGFTAMSLAGGRQAVGLLHVGLYTPMLLGLYLLALRSVFAHEQQVRRRAAADALAQATPGPDELVADGAAEVAAGAAAEEAAEVGRPRPQADNASSAPGSRRQREWLRFGASALLVLAAGSGLPAVAQGLAQVLGLSSSFVGTVFMAVATALPEMAVTLSALRLGALDLALGNLLGSNLFNLALLALDDLAYTAGPLLSVVAPVHLTSAASALVMYGLVIVGLVMRPQGKVLRILSWISVGLVAAYGLQAALIYLAQR